MRGEMGQRPSSPSTSDNLTPHVKQPKKALRMEGGRQACQDLDTAGVPWVFRGCRYPRLGAEAAGNPETPPGSDKKNHQTLLSLAKGQKSALQAGQEATEGTAVLQPDPTLPHSKAQGGLDSSCTCNEVTRTPLPAGCQDGPVKSQDSGPHQQCPWRPEEEPELHRCLITAGSAHVSSAQTPVQVGYKPQNVVYPGPNKNQSSHRGPGRSQTGGTKTINRHQPRDARIL